MLAAASTFPISALLDRQIKLFPHKPAIASARLSLTYEQLNVRAWRLARILWQADVRPGDRICILSENDPDVIVLFVAALRLGATVATLNPRLAIAELEHCIGLVTPKVLLISDQHIQRFPGVERLGTQAIPFGQGTALAERMSGVEDDGIAIPMVEVDPEAIQFIIYTSGTTGLPKAAMISQRAMLARLMVYVLDYRVDGDDTFLAWSPLCHMASVELGFGTLLLGGKVVVLDGPDLPVIADYLENECLSNLIFFPGMVEQAIEYLNKRRPKVRRLKKFGALADLFSPKDIAQLTALLNTPFTNTFGSTETGMPPLSAGSLAIGEVPADFGKQPSALCEVRIVDSEGNDCADDVAGELVVRGPTLFSGYWQAPQATEDVIRNGWFCTGDVFRRRSDGKYDYIDRRKYLIKSGGENIYPAEIERVILQHPGIADAVVVRRADAKWGEVPVVVAVARAAPPAAEELMAMCRQHLAAFKRPKDLFFVSADKLPRSGTGKIIRAEVESWVASGSIATGQERAACN